MVDPGSQPTHDLKIRLFGPFEALLNGQPLRTRTAKDLHVLAYLLIHHDLQVDRRTLVEVFWTQDQRGKLIGETNRYHLLSTTLTVLCKALGVEADRLDKPTPRTLNFRAEGADVDLAAVNAALTRGDSASLIAVADLYRRGMLLQGWDEDWVHRARKELKERWLGALEQAARRSQVLGDYVAGERSLCLALETAPLRETSLRCLLELLTEQRRFSAARERYETFCYLLWKEGSRPEQETENCFRHLLEEQRRFEGSPQAGAVPNPPSNFVPREKEITTIQQILASSRLVTLTGSGGVGKSRLAMEVARQVRENYFDRVWIVALASLSAPSSVEQAVASTLRVQEAPGRSLMETLCMFLRQKQLLLILDNCEHLIEACALLAKDLLSACPRLTILATSRQKLGIVGEAVWRVPLLAFPNPQSMMTSEAAAKPSPFTTHHSLLQYGAVRLFVERAASPQQPLLLTAENAHAVTQICARLDGIPLAIELAAACIRTLSVKEIAARLDDRFRLLTGGDPTALPRHQTLWALIDWSYNLLSAKECVLLCRLSVFAGGWTLEAAEKVCYGEGIEELEILDVLASLVDKSLVMAEVKEEGTCYRLLETVRQYGWERLVKSGESDLMRAHHRDYFQALAAEAAYR